MQSKTDTPYHDSNNHLPQLVWTDNGHAFRFLAIEGLIDILSIQYFPVQHKECSTVEQISYEVDINASPS